VVFVLFTVLVQATVLLLAHEVAESVVASAARSVASGNRVSSIDLERQLAGIVPGASGVRSSITYSRGVARVGAIVAVVPPGPAFGAVDMVVDAEIPIVVAP
jgi:hypothetical protein